MDNSSSSRRRGSGHQEQSYHPHTQEELCSSNKLLLEDEDEAGVAADIDGQILAPLFTTSTYQNHFPPPPQRRRIASEPADASDAATFFHFFDDISGDPSSLLDDFTPPASAAAATFQLSPSIFNCNSNSSNGTGNESQTANFSEELISQLPLSAREVPDKFDKPLHLLTRQDESVSEIGRSNGGGDGVFGANVFVVKASSGAKRNSFSLVSSSSMKHRKEGRVGVGPDSMGSGPPPPLPPQPATTTPSSSTATPSKRPHKEKELEKRFACTQCPKRFPTSKDLKRHDVVHTGNREFQCSFCTHRFGRKDHRMRHEKKTHAAELLLLEQQQQQQQQSSTSGSSKPANSTQHKSPVQKTSPDGAVGAGVLSAGVCRGATAPKRPRFRHVSSPSVFRSPPVTSGQAASAAAAAAAASPPIGPFRNMNMSSPPSNSHTLAVAKEEEANLILVKSEDQTDFLAELDITQCQQQQSHQQLLLGHEFKREIKEEPDVFDDSPTTTNQLNSFIEQTPPSLFSIHHQQQPPTTDQSNFVTLVGPNSSPAVVTSSTAEHQFNNSSSRCSSSLSDSLRSFLSKDRNIGSVKSEMESGQAVASALVTTDSTVNDTNEMMRVFEDFEAASSAMDCESVSDGGGGGAGLSVSVPAVFGGGSGVGIALRGERETQNVTTDGAAPASVILRSNTETGVLRMTTQQQHATEPLVIYRQHQAAPSLPVQREPISHQYSFSGFSPLETTTPSSPSYASSVGAARVATSPITDQPMSPGGSSGSGGGSGSTAGGSSLSSGNTGHSGCSVSTSDLLTRTKNPVLPSIYIDNSLIVPEPTKTKYQSSSSSGLHHGVSASDCPLFPPDLDEDDVDTFLRHAAASAAATPSAEGGGGREINDSFFNINTIN